MTDEFLYLRPDVQAEPLFDYWYAWSYLIPPATAARYVTERHLKIMSSYINAPRVHASAVKNPKLMGGPFIDYDGGRVPEIRALRDLTMKRCAHLMELSSAICALDEMLRAQGRGFSLQPLYEKVPDILKGYVELTYDLSNNPNFRIYEALLYRSRFYDTSLQSLMLSVTDGDHRAFAFSTPRLESDRAFHLPVPFDSERVDRLFEMRSSPSTWGEIKEILEPPASSEALVRSFFTTTPPAVHPRFQGSGFRWRYFGHACILVETPRVNILFDPGLSYEYESPIARYTWADLPESIDYVVFTHNHQDHVLFETLLQIRHKVMNVVIPHGSEGSLHSPSLRLILNKIGFKNVIELSYMESIEWENGSITAAPFLGEHSDLDIPCKAVYRLLIGERSLMFAADSCNIEPKLYEHVHREFGDADSLFLGMECVGAPLTWLYGPLLTKSLERSMDESRRLNGSNFEQAISLVRQFNCKSAFVYAMGQEPWLSYVLSLKYTDQSVQVLESNRLIQACEEIGITCERLFGRKETRFEEDGTVEQAHIANPVRFA